MALCCVAEQRHYLFAGALSAARRNSAEIRDLPTPESRNPAGCPAGFLDMDV